MALFCPGALAAAADDAYWRWASDKFSHAVASDPAQEAAVWGPHADPDGDGLSNLLEYGADTDPNQRTALSDVYSYVVPPGAPATTYPQLLAWQRTDDPDLRFVAQVSSDMAGWWPQMLGGYTPPVPANLYVTQEETGVRLGGMRQVRYRDRQPLAGRPGAFMRLWVFRGDAVSVGPGIEPFSFTTQPEAVAGATTRSNAVVLRGFTGTLTVAIPAGVTLFVNGVAQTGATATVRAGDTLWMQAAAPSTVGVPRNYTLTVGGHSATWGFATGAVAAVPNHPGVDSGYTPVETGVSETGAAQISVPIVVSPGTAGMQPKLAFNYSSQGGNGPLGLGFNLSGISTISRVGATVAQDGFKGGVTFDDNDRFAFDGQRLISTNGRSGTDGAEYRLEFDPGTRIRSYGVAGNGPERWVVETKAGLTLDFGLGANSRVFPEDGHSPLVWAVEKITDTAGHAMAFTYDKTARLRGELSLTLIAYTSNPATGLAAEREVLRKTDGLITEILRIEKTGFAKDAVQG